MADPVPDTEGLSEERVLLEEIEMHKRARSHLTGLAAKKERRAEAAEARVDELLAENERLREALRKYGNHTRDCGYWRGDYRRCTCGFQAALDADVGGDPADSNPPVSQDPAADVNVELLPGD